VTTTLSRIAPVRYHQPFDPFKSARQAASCSLCRITQQMVLRIATVLLALFGIGVGVPAAPPDLFDQLHARIAAAEATRQTIRARFTETTTSSLLARPMVAHGTLVGEKSAPGKLIGAKPTRMLITYTSPERKTILFDTNRLVIIHPDGSAPERIDITEIMKTVNRYFTNATPGQLRRAFTVRAFVDPDLPAFYQVDLVPKRKQITQGLERLQIWVAKDTCMLAQMKMSFPGGDSDVFKLEDVELNVPISPRTFELDVPPAPKSKKQAEQDDPIPYRG
jgi:outer membrane lipoprotein-sorting protein